MVDENTRAICKGVGQVISAVGMTLLERIESLERRLDESEILSALGEINGPGFAERLSAIEAQAAHFENFGYVGVWREGGTYQRGNFVTMDGGLWHCCRDDATTRPGTNGDDWRLCVKRARQGR
jgi:hypothetical protein